MPAADEWMDLRQCSPIPGCSYLVATKAAGVALDVAFFYGARPDGGLWWTMTNAEFPSNAVTHWASLNEPSQNDNPPRNLAPRP